MSGKSAKGPAKKLSVPRTMEEITAAYQPIVAKAGNLQYQLLIGSEDLAQLNEQLRRLNQEASARQQLDAAKAPEQAPPPQEAAPAEEPMPVSGAV